MINKILNKKIALWLLCIFYIVATYVALTVSFSSSISVSAATDENYTINVEADYDSSYDLYEAQMLYNAQIAAEGIVVLDNKEDANGDTLLPMGVNDTGDHKISIFGKRSADYEYHPEGAGDASAGSYIANGTTLSSAVYDEEVTFYDAFRGEDRQAYSSNGTVNTGSYVYPSELMSQSFTINETLAEFYEDDAASPATQYTLGSGGGHFSSFYGGMPIAETPVAYYTDEVQASYSDYDDAAIVVLSRMAGEGSDMPKTMLGWETDGEWDGSWSGYGAEYYNDDNKMDGARHWDDHYLQLDENEVAMLQMVMLNFTDIIIVCNTNSQLEIGFMNDPGHYLFSDNDFATTLEKAGLTVEQAMARLRASMYISYTGTSGAVPIAQIIDGSVNPSGKTTNIWNRDFKLDPTWQNQGFGEQAGGCATSNTYVTQWANNFVHYDEDIYLGYRYYETRYVEDGDTSGITNFATTGDTDKNNGSIYDQSFSTTTTEWDSWYDSAVLYPFGYGISYTDFTWSDISIVTDATDGVSLEEAGTVTATVTVTNTGDYAGKDVVQLYYSQPYYDAQIQKSHVSLGGFAKTSELAPGASETLTITMPVEYMKSYDWSDANNNGIQGYEMDYGDYYITLATDSHDAANLNESTTTKFTLGSSSRDNIYFQYDLDTGAEVVNSFDYSSGTSFNNGVATDSESFKGVMQYMMRNDFSGTWPTHTVEKKTLYQAIGLSQTKESETITQAVDEASPWYSDVVYEDQATVATDDADIKLWHMTGRDYSDPLWEEFLDQLTMEEMANLIGICNYTTAAMENIDKPLVKDNDGALGAKACTSIHWVANPIVAQTFNQDITYTQGRLYATSAHFGKSGNAPGGIYGTGLETHRSPFAGRNAEYYSEDPVLGGLMCAPYMEGADDAGVFITIKHFGLNNCDTMRGTVSTWASEQAIREIYCKAYEIIIKEDHTHALMSATNYVGDQSAATCYSLLTTLLRTEWGFEGFVLSDMTKRDPDKSMRAGNDLQLQGSANLITYAGDENTTLHTLRLAFKNLVYVYANTQIMNGYGGDSLDNYKYTGSTAFYGKVDTDEVFNIGTSVETTLCSDSTTGQKFTLASGSTLPEGMTLSSDGKISGNTESSGTYSISVIVSEDIPTANDPTPGDGEGSNKIDTVAFPYNSITVDLTLTILPATGIPEDIVYPTQQLPDAAQGYEYSQNIASAVYYVDEVANTDISYTLASGSTLPDGLTLSNGVISGTVTAATGLYMFDVTATANDASSGKDPKTATLMLEVKEYAISYAATTLESYDVGDSVSFSVATASASSGNSVSYSLASGSSLPSGLSLSNTGNVTGTAAIGCTDYEFSVTASSTNAASTTVTYKITINGIECTSQTYGELIYDKDYAIDISGFVNDASGVDITYTLKEGSTLASGFTLYENGMLVGTAYDIGQVSFIVECSADGYDTVEITITLYITDLENGLSSSTSVDDAIDFDAYNQEVEDALAGCAGGLSTVDMAFISLILLGAAMFITFVSKKKSSNK